MNAGNIALQLYTVREDMARDPEGTLRKVAAMGYAGVETGGYRNGRLEMLQRVQQETGMRVVGIHGRLSALETELDREIAFCEELGCRYITLSWLEPEERRDVSRLAERLNALGRRCRDAGMTLSHHNHGFEFARTEDGIFLDELLAATDPHLVALELDVYWAAYGGADPIDYLRRYSGRIPLVHLKDMTPDRTFTEVGDGVLDMQAILHVAGEGGAEWYIVENDEPGPQPLESARRSLENLQAMSLPAAPSP